MLLLLPVLGWGLLEVGSLLSAMNRDVSGKSQNSELWAAFFPSPKAKPAGWESLDPGMLEALSQLSRAVNTGSAALRLLLCQWMGRPCFAVGIGGAGPRGAGAVGWEGPSCGVHR